MNNNTERKIVSNLPTMITKEYYTKRELESHDVSQVQSSNSRNIRDELLEDRQRSLAKLNIRARPGVTLE